jgi:hypothetical protein
MLAGRALSRPSRARRSGLRGRGYLRLVEPRAQARRDRLRYPHHRRTTRDLARHAPDFHKPTWMGTAGPVSHVDEQATYRREHLMALSRRIDPQAYGFLGSRPIASVTSTSHVQFLYPLSHDGTQLHRAGLRDRPNRAQVSCPTRVELPRDSCLIRTQSLIACDESCPLEHRLGNKEAVKRIAMMPGELGHCLRMLDAHG